MLWVLLASPSWAWTCTEASFIWANEPLESRATGRLRNGWSYTPDKLKCLLESGVPKGAVDQLRAATGETFSLSVPGALHTVVLDLGCGTLAVKGQSNAELTLSGLTTEQGPPLFDVVEGIATVRRNREPMGVGCADIAVTAPASARLLVFHRGTHVHVSGMTDAVEITAAEANIVVQGATKLVEVDALRGDVLVDITGSVEVEAGSGTVLIAAGSGATVRSTTVVGNQFIWGGPLRRLDASSVQGDIRSQAGLQPSAIVEARSNSGNVLVGVSKAQSALMPMTNADPRSLASLLKSDDGGSMRPDRVLPDGTRLPTTCFECLPGEVRNVWLPGPPVRTSLSSGAKVLVHSPEYGHGLRVHAESLTGISATPVLNRPPALATGHIIESLEAQAATSLAACRADLARPPPAVNIDLWAHIDFNGGVAKSVTFNVEGFDPKVLACVKSALGKWTVPESNRVEVDWPLKLLVVRSTPP